MEHFCDMDEVNKPTGVAAEEGEGADAQHKGGLHGRGNRPQHVVCVPQRGPSVPALQRAGACTALQLSQKTSKEKRI